ncbi:hypothetical protein TNCV_3153621 [Trichonephila clavipes]|nr:hypothetical protein TNCV_3153621 [Trichonephila clavipes]
MGFSTKTLSRSKGSTKAPSSSRESMRRKSLRSTSTDLTCISISTRQLSSLMVLELDPTIRRMQHWSRARYLDYST